MRAGTILVDRFRIEHEAGAGGMGTVYRALDLLTGEPVALKVLREESAVDAHRLARESTVLASLGDPGIVRHVAHGIAPGGAPFLAMEWLDGMTLSARLRGGTLPLADAIGIVRATASALSVAHARGIIHRDVKPGNLFLVGGDAGAVKLLDFGIARRVGDQSLSLTTSGTVLGTPYYMSPEQARGQRTIDARADVWALGCVLYEMLAGRPPFDHESMVAVLAAIILEQPAPIADQRGDVPVDVELLVMRLLSKDAHERPADGAALVRALDALGPIQASSSTAPTASPRALTEREQRVVCLVLVERGIGVRPDAATLQSSDVESIEGRVRSAAEAHLGRVEVLADGSLIVNVGDRALGTATTPTDHAARAARCAIVLREILPEAAIAIAAGRARMEGRVPVGEVIESGASLLACPLPEGAPRGIRVDAVVASLVEGRFEVGSDAHGRVLVGIRQEPDTGRTLLGRASPCVGRDRELALLEDLYEECARDPIARVALVTAGPGAGKSRLLAELLRRLSEKHASAGAAPRDGAPLVLSARGDPMASGSPFGLLAQALRGAAGIAPGEPLEARREKLRARMGRHMDGAAALRAAAMLGEIAGVPFDDAQDEVLRAARRDPQLRGDLARRALEDFLAAETMAGPVVLALDDLHLGDRPSLAFVDAALRHSAGRPLFVIGLGRPEVDDLFPDLFVDRDPQALRLGRLTPRAARALVVSALGPAAPDAVIQRLIERADGNPFFLEELVRAASEGSTDELPESVLGMVEARLSALDAEPRRVLRAASVFGASAPRGGILSLLGATARPAPIDERLRELVDRELLARRDLGAEPGYAFRSALAREAAYAMLTAEDRALGHRLAGAFLEDAGESDPLVLAEHYDRGGDRSRAAAWWARAAERALDGDDLGRALERAERGLAGRPEPAVRAGLLGTKAAVHRWRGEYEIALEVAKEAASLARRGTLAFFDAISIVLSASGQLGLHAEVEPLVASVFDAADADAIGAQIVAICRAAAQLLARGDRTRADLFVGRAEALALDLASDDPLAFAWIEVIRASRALRDGDVGAFAFGTEAAVTFYERAGDARDACNQRVRLANGWVSLGEPARAEPVLRAALAEAQRIGLPLIAGYALQNLGHALALQHRSADARGAERSAIEIAKALGDELLEAGANVYLSDLELAAGAPQLALAHAREAARAIGAHPFALVAEASRIRAELACGSDRAKTLEDAMRVAHLAEQASGLEEGEARIRVAQLEAMLAAAEPAGALDRERILGDARVIALRARDALSSRAAKISDPALRDGFLHRVTEHARILELARALT